MLRGEGRGKPAFALFFAPVVFGGAVEWNSFIWPKNRPRKEHNLWAASRPAGGENIMARICFILVAGLDAHVHARAKKPLDFAFSSTLRPVLPAVTCTMQATLTTGATPAEHGIISNGLYAYGNSDLESLIDTGSFADFRRQVSFWEQSADLLQKPRFWNGRGWKTAMLFWQQSIPGRRAQDAADIVLTPKPEHGPDGKTISACWSRPADLYGQMVAEFGSFPLHQYWGPMASLPATAWIIQSARAVWRKHSPDIQFVYIPHLDYNLQRLGPDHAGTVFRSGAQMHCPGYVAGERVAWIAAYGAGKAAGASFRCGGADRCAAAGDKNCGMDYRTDGRMSGWLFRRNSCGGLTRGPIRVLLRDCRFEFQANPPGAAGARKNPGVLFVWHCRTIHVRLAWNIPD